MQNATNGAMGAYMIGTYIPHRNLLNMQKIREFIFMTTFDRDTFLPPLNHNSVFFFFLQETLFYARKGPAAAVYGSRDVVRVLLPRVSRGPDLTARHGTCDAFGGPLGTLLSACSHDTATECHTEDPGESRGSRAGRRLARLSTCHPSIPLSTTIGGQTFQGDLSEAVRSRWLGTFDNTLAAIKKFIDISPDVSTQLWPHLTHQVLTGDLA